MDDNLRNNPNLWHAASAAVDITETFGITDREIASAIRYHTTGKADMSLLEVILYMADLTDETRDYDDVDFYRTLATTTGSTALGKLVDQYILPMVESGSTNFAPLAGYLMKIAGISRNSYYKYKAELKKAAEL